MGRYIFTCEDSVDGIFSAVYTAWSARVGHMNVRLAMKPKEGDGETYELFSEYIDVETDSTHSLKVARAIREKISERAFEMTVRAALSNASDKADAIYHFLVLGFAMGAAVTEHLTDYYVSRVFELDRYVMHDAHLNQGFLRFEEVEHGILLARYEPVNDVTAILAEHFSDRFSGENFIIYDIKRQLAAVHEKNRHFVMVSIENDVMERFSASGVDDKYKELWKVFFDSIAIDERKNPALQRNNLRLHYRKHMTEFMTRVS